MVDLSTLRKEYIISKAHLDLMDIDPEVGKHGRILYVATARTYN
jgi:hypothetical protein